MTFTQPRRSLILSVPLGRHGAAIVRQRIWNWIGSLIAIGATAGMLLASAHGELGRPSPRGGHVPHQINLL